MTTLSETISPRANYYLLRKQTELARHSIIYSWQDLPTVGSTLVDVTDVNEEPKQYTVVEVWNGNVNLHDADGWLHTKLNWISDGLWLQFMTQEEFQAAQKVIA